MRCGIALFALTLSIIPTPSSAAGTGAPGASRQISEIVFRTYPPRALAAGEEGPVFFTVQLDEAARATACQVTGSSGHPLLDAETCALVMEGAVFRSALDGNRRLLRPTAEGVVNWSLPGHAPKQIAIVDPPVASAPERRICKKSVRIGTLAGVERTCMTASEWDKHSAQMKAPFEDLQGRKGNSVCTQTVGSDGLPPQGEFGC